MKKEEIYKVLDEIIRKNINYMEYSEFLKSFLYGLLLKKIFDQGKVSVKFDWTKLMKMDMSDTYKYIKGSLELLLKDDEDLLNALDELEISKTGALWTDMKDFLNLFNGKDEVLTLDVLNKVFFIDVTDRKTGDFSCSKEIYSIINGLFDLQSRSSYYDPSCGKGRAFLNAWSFENSIDFYGQESDKDNFIITKLLLKVLDKKTEGIFLGDTLGNPGNIEDDEMKKFDRVYIEAPFIIKVSRDIFSDDDYMRFKFGIPNLHSAGWGFIQHGLSSLKADGVMAAVVSSGNLFTTDSETIRKNILKTGHIRAVISFPDGLLQGTGIPFNLMFFDNNDNKEVFMMDVESLIKERGVINKSTVEKIIEIVKSGKPVKGVSKKVKNDVIKDNSYNFSPGRYIIKKEFSKSETLVFNFIKNSNQVKLEDVADITYGYHANPRKKIENGKPVKFVRITNINKDGMIDFDTIEPINAPVDKLERVILKENDIVLSVRGTIDKVGIVKNLPEDVICAAGMNMALIRIIDNKYSPLVLFEMLRSFYGKALLNGLAKGAAIKGISIKELKTVMIPVIPEEKIAGYKERVESIDEKINRYNKKISDMFEEREKEFFDLFSKK